MALTRPKIRDIDTSIIAFNDPMTVLNQGSTIANVDVGFLFNRANGLVSNVALYWSESAQSLVTAYTTDSGVGTSNVSVASYANLTIGNMLMVNGSILNVTGNIHANIVGNLYGSVESTGNLTTSANISAAGFYWANGTPFVSSSYGNLEVSYYLPLYTGTLGNVTTSNIVVINNSTISTSVGTGALQVTGGVGIAGSLYIANTGDVSANIGNYQNWANANVASLYHSILGANAAIITANNAVVSYVDTLNTAMAGNVASANSAIITANNAVVSYVNALNTAMAGNVAGANAAIVTANTALKNYTDNQITTANSAVVSYVDTLNAAMAGNVSGANAAIVTANTALKGYVDTQITNLVGGAPVILDTLNEIAISLGNNAQLSTTLLGAITGANAAIVTANTDMKAYVDAQNVLITTAWQSNAATQDNSITAIEANVGSFYTYANATYSTISNASSLQSQILGANAAIVTANTDMKAYVDAANTIQSGQIVTLQSQVYANANVSAYLPTYSGSLGGTLTTASQTNITTLGTLTGLTSSGIVQITNATDNDGAVYTSGALRVTGGAGFGGNVFIGGNAIITGNVISSTGNITVANISGSSGQFFGDAAGYGALYAGIASGYSLLPYTPLQITTNFNAYSQLNQQNINGDAQASTDYVVTANNGNDSSFYGDFGIASSTYSYPSLGLTAVGPNDVYLLGVGYSSFGPYTGNVGNVVISSSNGMIKLATGGANVANVVATVVGTGLAVNASTTSTSTSTGALTVAGGVGIQGALYIANTGDVSANIGSFYVYANTTYNTIANASSLQSQILGANAAIVTANNAVVSYVGTLNTAMASNVAGANAAIVTANSALKAYTDYQITTANGAVVSYVNTLNTAMAGNVAGANAAIVTANTAMKGYVDNQITTLIGGAPAALDTLYEISNSLGNNASLSTTLLNSIAGANAAIVTANTALKAYVDDRDTTITNAWTANAATQQGLITTLQSQVYTNSNIASYLTTYTGNITAGNITANTAGTTTTVANLVTTNGVFWANGTAYSSGSGGGTGITYTASATAPTSPHVGDQWYYTTGDILYEYQNVGTGTFWIDITSPIIASGNTTTPGSDTLSPFLLMGA